MNTKTIKFDLNKYKLYEKIKAKQGDTKSRFLLFQLLDGSIPFNLKNRSVRAYMIKPDGREIFNDLIVNNYNLGYCTLELTNQVLAAQGIVKIELMVTEGDKKLTSSVFELEVVKSINSEKSIVSTNEFTALLNGLAALSEYDNYKNSVKEMEINKANKAEVEEKFISVEEKIKNNSEQLDTKMNKTDKIKSSQLDTSSDSSKIGILNLSEEAIQTLTRPLQLRMGNGDFQIGYDIEGSINTSNDKVVCNTNLLNVEKDRCIKIETSFNYRVLIAYYKDNTFIRRDDFIDYGNDKIDLVGNDFNQIRLSFQKYPNDTEAINLLTDIIKVYVGYSTMIAEIKDNSITTEKYGDNSITNIKLEEPLIKLFPWDTFYILNKAENETTIKFFMNNIFSFSNGKYARVSEDVVLTISDGQLLYLNFDSSNTGDVNVSNFIIENALTFKPSSTKFVLLFNYGNKLITNIYKFNSYIDNYSGDSSSTYGSVLTVGKSKAMFTTINQAVDYARPLANINNPITIIVYPGTYKEVVNLLGTSYISIIGVNKITCVLRDDSGQYLNAPLRVEGQSYISNMTIIATHEDDTSTPVDSLRSYAVHADDDGEGTTEFNNCILISYQNAALGCGLHTNQTVKLIDCELYSYCPNESTMKDNGALYLHDGSEATNQNVIVKNCIIKSLYGKSAYLNGHYGTEVIAHFYNNMFWCEETGKDSIRLDSANGGISNNIKLSSDSYGNNVNILNA